MMNSMKWVERLIYMKGWENESKTSYYDRHKRKATKRTKGIRKYDNNRQAYNCIH